jgi:hypothetical protein
VQQRAAGIGSLVVEQSVAYAGRNLPGVRRRSKNPSATPPLPAIRPASPAWHHG